MIPEASAGKGIVAADATRNRPSGWLLLVGAAILVAIVALAAIWYLSRGEAATVSYWSVGPRTLGVQVWEPSDYSCAIARTQETKTQVQIVAECRAPLLRVGSAGKLHEFDFEVQLAAPLGDRRVVDWQGYLADRCANPRCR
jgi:hypothetical protein